MSHQCEEPSTECTLQSFSSGIKVWWENEMRPCIKYLRDVALAIGSITSLLLIIAHAFFPLGVLISGFLPSGTPAPASYLAFEHTPEVVFAFTCLGLTPITLLIGFAVWIWHVCNLGRTER